MSLIDPNSFSNPDSCKVTNFHLNLGVDFDAKVLKGHIIIYYENIKDTNVLILDTRDLNVSKCIDLNNNDKELNFHFGEESEAFGSAMHIELSNNDKEGQIRIDYSTHPNSSAIQWLPPSQTAGKVHPYLFTQCQAIHARALLPCQDSPYNKCPYTACITVDKPLVALMSALQDGSNSTDKTTTYKFKQPVPMPSYLVALGVGALEKRDIGKRCAVWSEKEMVEQGAYEFAETEKFLEAAENIAGPYVWGRYDVLLLPPSFPYGGMENPCLTFVTPTLLAGDRSLANVVAHEIAHSWMGNLVSPKNWEHFWLNEGFTVFLERKIMRAMKDESHQHLHACIGWNALRDSVDHFGSEHPYTALVLDLKGVDPDDSFSSIPYEKGFNFLFYLQTLVGGEEVMNEFLRAHCEEFKYRSIDSYEWKAFFLQYFGNKVEANKLESIDWDLWFKGTGLPPSNNFDRTLVEIAHNLATNQVNGTVQASPKDFDGWSSNQVVLYLEQLQDLQAEIKEDQPCKELLETIDKVHNLTQSKNAEIRFRWYQLCLRARINRIFDHVVSMLSEVGRMKFVRPLYRELNKTPEGKKVAIDAFAKFKDRYHNICSKMVAKDLNV